MLDQEFCIFLEYEICKALANSKDPEVTCLWCDGVLLPAENYYSQKTINDVRTVNMVAFIGKDGQDKYELILSFGNKALRRYARKLHIYECFPDFEKDDSFTLDVKKRIVKINLL